MSLPPTFFDDLHHVLAGPLIHQLAEDLTPLLARRHQHPLTVALAYLALRRSAGSGNRLDAILADGPTWERAIRSHNAGAADHGGRLLGAGSRPPKADTFRSARDRLCADLPTVLTALTTRSLDLAIGTGLLPARGGSLTRPARARTLYGDGTIVRPLYRPDTPGRTDPSIARHTRHDGQLWGNNLVTAYVRGPERHHRVILGIARVDQPGGEAATAVQLFTDVTRAADGRVQAIAYDGAWRGTHHNQLMHTLGVVVVNRVHGASRPANGDAPRVVPLTNRTHHVDGRPCTHTLVTVDGSVAEAHIDAAGNSRITEPYPRRQVRRARTTTGYRFTLGIDIPCPRQPFTTWIAIRTHADHLRLLPPTDPHFDVIYGLRNDSESNNHNYKTTLPNRRAAGLGWQRQVLDAVGWAILTNARAHALHGTGIPKPAPAPARRTVDQILVTAGTISRAPAPVQRSRRTRRSAPLRLGAWLSMVLTRTGGGGRRR